MIFILIFVEYCLQSILALLRTSSNIADSNRFRSHTRNNSILLTTPKKGKLRFRIEIKMNIGLRKN